MNIASHMYMYGLPNTTPHTSRGTSSRSTSSIKSTLIENLILHYFFTFGFASLCTHPSRYGFGWSQTSSPNLLIRFSAMRFSCNPKSNKASNFILLTYIVTSKRLVIYFSYCCWKLLKFTSFYTNVQMIFSSTFELLSTWFLESMAMRFFFLLSYFLFFMFSSGWNFHHLSSLWSSML